MDGSGVVIGNENALWSPASSKNTRGGHIIRASETNIKRWWVILKKTLYIEMCVE